MGLLLLFSDELKNIFNCSVLISNTGSLNTTHIIKNSFSSEDPVKKIKTQTTEWGKIFTNSTSDKGLVYRLC